MTRRVCIAAAILACATSAASAVRPTPGATDSRIQTVAYDPDQVTLLKGYIGYQTMIEFGTQERIENVAVGDAQAWQVTPNKQANLLFLKPLTENATTNLTVVTDQRHYVFDLSIGSASSDDTERAYIVRFRFPTPPKAAATATPHSVNSGYVIRGARSLAPEEVFDDGHFTYFRWPPTAAAPAVFAVDERGDELLPNAGVRNGLLVVEQIAPKFILRIGRDEAMVTRRQAADTPTLNGSRR